MTITPVQFDLLRARFPAEFATTRVGTAMIGSLGAYFPIGNLYIGLMLATTWTASTAVTVGTYVVTANVTAYNSTNRHIFVCTAAGTTGLLEPTWDQFAGSVTTDGTAQWTEASPQFSGTRFVGDVPTFTGTEPVGNAYARAEVFHAGIAFQDLLIPNPVITWPAPTPASWTANANVVGLLVSDAASAGNYWAWGLLGSGSVNVVVGTQPTLTIGEVDISAGGSAPGVVAVVQTAPLNVTGASSIQPSLSGVTVGNSVLLAIGTTGLPVTQVFSATGSFVVPANLVGSTVTFEAVGASGQAFPSGQPTFPTTGQPGAAAQVTATVPATPGETFNIVVATGQTGQHNGGVGASGAYNAGGSGYGGGSSAVIRQSSSATELEAAGGGGFGGIGNGYNFGAFDPEFGTNGGYGGLPVGGNATIDHDGATQSADGVGGTSGQNNGTSGSSGTGGAGAGIYNGVGNTFAGGGGGGGGGWKGGGGGSSGTYGYSAPNAQATGGQGGGGGASYAAADATSVSYATPTTGPLVVATYSVTAPTVSGVTGGVTGTWANITAETAGSTLDVELWLGTLAPAGFVQPTVTLNGYGNAGALILELVNAGTASAGSNATGTSGTVAGNGQTVGTVNSLVVIASAATNAETSPPGTPWTALAGPLLNGAQMFGLAYQQASANTSSTSWTQTSGPYATAAAVIAPS